MGWRGRGGGGLWPGRGPFSHLPPWQRPGWLYGRGACWWLYAPYSQTTTPAVPTMPFVSPTSTKEQEISVLEQQAKLFEQTLGQIRKRLEELKK